MSTLFHTPFVVIAYMLLAPLSLGAVWQAHCDIPGHDLANHSVGATEDCAAKCLATKGCRAAVFVSGWQKCFLKHKASRRATIVFHSGHRHEKGMREDTDFNGKDLERHVVKTPTACRETCVNSSSCASFTFISGYDVCWLKAKTTRETTKIFSCWERPTTESGL